MSNTLFGSVLIFLTLFIMVINFRYILGLLIIFLSLQMTSVINFTSLHYGLQLYRVVSILLSLSLIFFILKNDFKFNLSYEEVKLINFLTSFVLYTVFISLVGPLIFENILVYTPKYSIDYNAMYGPFPLKFSLINIVLPFNEILFYLVFVLILIINLKNKEINFIIKCFFFTIVMILFFSFYQLFQSFINLPNIFTFINNTVSRQFHLFTVNLSGFNIFRIAATYYEPSYLASFLIAIFSFFLSSFILYRKYLLFLILTFVIIILSTSSTTYLSLLIIILFVLFYTGIFSIKIKKVRLNHFLYLLMFLSIIVIIIINVIGIDNILLILNQFLFEKSKSYSFINRTKADLYSFQIFLNSFGLGVGVGSTRPSSLFPYLISTVGIIGTVLFFTFLILLLRYSYKILRNTNYYNYFFLIPGALVTQIIAYPDITNPTLWQMIYVTIIVIKKVKYKEYRYEK